MFNSERFAGVDGYFDDIGKLDPNAKFGYIYNPTNSPQRVSGMPAFYGGNAAPSGPRAPAGHVRIPMGGGEMGDGLASQMNRKYVDVPLGLMGGGQQQQAPKSGLSGIFNGSPYGAGLAQLLAQFSDPFADIKRMQVGSTGKPSFDFSSFYNQPIYGVDL